MTYEANQIEILQCKITPADGGEPKDVLGILAGFQVTEDLFVNFLTASVTLKDAYGLIAKGPIVGIGDKLSLVFKTPNFPEINITLYSYAISERFHMDTMVDLYTISFTSRPAFVSEYKTISKYYKGTTTDIIHQIASEEMEIPYVMPDEEADEEIECIIPNWNALKAVNWLIAKTIPSRNPWDTSCHFYEDIDGVHHITSIGKLNEGDAVCDYIHARIDKNKSVEDRLQNVHTFSFNVYDQLNQMRDGADYSSVLTHDITRKYFTVTEYKAKDHFDKATRLIDERHRAKAETGDNPYAQIYDNDPTLYRYYPKAQRLFDVQEDWSGQDKVGKDDSVEPGFDWLTSRIHQDKNCRSMKLTMEVPGWSARRVGDKFKVSREDMVKTPRQDEDDKFSGGEYLITTIKHTLTTIGGFGQGLSSYRMFVSAVRDSLKE